MNHIVRSMVPLGDHVYKQAPSHITILLVHVNNSTQKLIFFHHVLLWHKNKKIKALKKFSRKEHFFCRCFVNKIIPLKQLKNIYEAYNYLMFWAILQPVSSQTQYLKSTLKVLEKVKQYVN